MLAIVPARGQSKGIPRKNVRALAGRPLILHTLETLTQVPEVERIIVSTDDDEIAAVARLHGYEVQDRPPRLARDDTTIAEVVEYAATLAGWVGPVGVFQPTSPTVQARTVQNACTEFTQGGYDSLGSVVADTKLRWNVSGPLHTERQNRQYADPEWAETGGIQLTRDPARLVGVNHKLFPVNVDEAWDIDTLDDWEACRRQLARRRINIRVCAGQQVGAGHLYRCFSLAEELSHHAVAFDTGGLPMWAHQEAQKRRVKSGRWDNPDLVVCDTLDTTVEQVAGWKAEGAHVVTLEDLGAGSDLADLVVNELYEDTRHNAVCGPRWAVLRPEFLALTPVEIAAEAHRVLVLFGGTDPAHLSERVAAGLLRDMEVTVLVGPGAAPHGFPDGVDVRRSGNVAELVRRADLVVTSAGRTVHEVAACGVPVVSVAANERESRHSHCDGVLRLGLHATLSGAQITECVQRVAASPELRAEMAATARAQVDGLGARRIAHRIDGMLEGL